MSKLNHKKVAETFSALGHPKRIYILETLLDGLPHDATFGQIQQSTGIPASTLTHHLREMNNGNITVRKPDGASTRIGLNLSHLQKILAGMMDKCCKNASGNTND